ncbi:START domain-containing protein [Joostella sp. CR20]|uniref:START domain-containing protein n=1 Tax=Joostella sp. CR20 TaxID=2804312 RepID=UPI00313C2B64
MKPLILFCLLFTSYVASAQEWSLKKSSNNIEVYTRSLDSTKINEYKVTLLAKASAEDALKILTDGNSLKKWNYKTPKSEIVKKISDNEFIFWMENDLPWPLSDRDNVSHIKVNKTDTNSYKIDIQPADSYYQNANKNVIRMDNFKGHWLIKSVGKDSVQVTQQMYGDPKGHVPNWLVNSILTTFPYHSFENLKEILEN